MGGGSDVKRAARRLSSYMKIAFISYEYPPDTADGGIATYVLHAARMLRRRGHLVEVFAGTRGRSETSTEPDGVIVHRVNVAARQEFMAAVVQPFRARHEAVHFDVLEGPDYGADAAEAARWAPEAALVVKLHTPTFLVERLDRSVLTRAQRIRHRARDAYRTIIRKEAAVQVRRLSRRERAHTRSADEVTAPSRAIADLVSSEWNLAADRLSHVPYPYHPGREFLSIPAEGSGSIVTFVGRLEIRKGVTDLAAAAHAFLVECPGASLRFVGGDGVLPAGGSVTAFLQSTLRRLSSRVEYLGQVAPTRVPAVLADSSVVVLPSRWENFPFSCLEAMSAGRPVVAGRAGGMSEMICNGESGMLVRPACPDDISRAVIRLLRSPSERGAMGTAARERVLSAYAYDGIGRLQEESYARALARAGARRALRGA
jgi:glycogen synthase